MKYLQVWQGDLGKINLKLIFFSLYETFFMKLIFGKLSRVNIEEEEKC